MSRIDEWVSAEFQRLAEVINEYDPNLFLEWIPPEKQEDLIDKEKCFRIVDDSRKQVVMYFDSLHNPTAILKKLFDADQAKNNVIVRLDNANIAAQILKEKEREEVREQLKDFTSFVAKNTKSRWTHEGRIRDDEFRDLGPKTSVIV